jgi:hypothetical protein
MNICYIKNDPQSTYTQHILQNLHEYGTFNDNVTPACSHHHYATSVWATPFKITMKENLFQNTGVNPTRYFN